MFIKRIKKIPYFTKISSREKKRIIKEAVIGSNKEQKDLVEEYERRLSDCKA